MCHPLIKLLLMAFLVIVTLTMDCELDSNDKYKTFTNWKNYTGQSNKTHQIYCRIGNNVKHPNLVNSDKPMSGYESGYYTFLCKKAAKSKLTVVEIYQNKTLSSLNVSDLCEPRLCQPPDSKLNVISKCNPVCQTGHYDCISGYTMKPDPQNKLYLYCTKTNGEMLAEQPRKCTATICSKKPDESAFHVIDKPSPYQTGEYECLDGYLPAHPSSDNYTRMNCINDSWSSENACVPVCQIVSNNETHLQAVEKTRENSTVTVTCKRGYQDSQSTKRSVTINAKCMNETFVYENTSQPVECVPETCTKKPDELNYTIVDKPAPYQTGKYECLDGYLPAYPSSDNYTWLYCSNNVWSIDEICHPVCQIPANNERHLQALERKRQNSTVTVTCERGYQDINSTERSPTIEAKCLNGQIIREGGSELECVEELCFLPAPNNLFVQIDDNQTSGETGLIIPCRDGYAPPISKGETDSIELLCYNNVWEGRGEDDLCLRMCDSLTSEAYDEFTEAANESFRHGSQAQVVCRSGFQINNATNATVVCDDGIFLIENTDVQVMCEPVLCSTPPDSQDLHIAPSNILLSGMTVSCADGYAPSIKHPTVDIRLVCEFDIWTPFSETDVCLPLCPLLKHGSAEQQQRIREGQTQVSRCIFGFVLNTYNTTHCYNGSLMYEDVSGNHHPVVCLDESLLLAEQNSESHKHKVVTKQSWYMPVFIASILLIILITVIICIVRWKVKKQSETQNNISERCDKLMQVPDLNEENKKSDENKTNQDKDVRI